MSEKTILFGPDTVLEESQIEKYSGLLGAILSGVAIKRTDKQGRSALVNVPIMYGAGNARNRQTGDNDVNYGTNLPAMSFELVDMALDSARVTANMPIYGALGKTSPYARNTTWTPRPYDFTYSLTIRANTLKEAFLTFETIAVQFDPVLAIKVSDQREAGIERDISFYLDPSPQIQDNYQESFEQARYVDITATFTVKGFLYKPATTKPVVLDCAFDLGWTTVSHTATDKQKREFLGEHISESMNNRLHNSQKEVANGTGKTARSARARKPRNGS